MKRVLLLHTGGTLAMRGEPLEPDAFSQALSETVPELGELAELDTRVVASLDSSDIGPAHWTTLATTIGAERDRYDGFVIVHGTDTMAYTASALTFALEGLDRPVILTGAQRPLASVRSDARRNLVDAVELATCDIPEVGICFDGLLLRGCRASKNNGLDYRAFESLGTQPLARMGVKIELADHIRRPNVPFRCDARFVPGVMTMQVTPGMSPALLASLFEGGAPGLHGIVLLAFGLGTLPTKFDPLAPVFADLIARDIDVLVITSSMGAVDMTLYQNSVQLQDAGAISGGRMGVEAAVTKLMHARARHADREERRRYLEWNVAGERSRS